MKRKLLAIGLALSILTGATMAMAGPIVGPSDIPASAQCELAEDLGVWVCTTTSTSPTTTTLPPTTTTTQPPTTTTTAPPTTTTTVAPSVPEYIDLGTLQKGEGYEITMDDITNAPDLIGWWDANYFFELPYGGVFGWGDGDRCGYRGAYGFLIENGTKAFFPNYNDQYDLNGGTVIGRFHAASIRDNVGELYMRISDGFMIEGQRHFDGTLDRGPTEPGFDECPDPLEAYTAYNGPDQRPTIVFYDADGNVAEVRSYPHTNVEEANIIFRIADGVGGVNGTVAVTAHDLNNGGLPGVVFYYTAMNGGRVELIP